MRLVGRLVNVASRSRHHHAENRNAEHSQELASGSQLRGTTDIAEDRENNRVDVLGDQPRIHDRQNRAAVYDNEFEPGPQLIEETFQVGVCESAQPRAVGTSRGNKHQIGNLSGLDGRFELRFVAQQFGHAGLQAQPENTMQGRSAKIEIDENCTTSGAGQARRQVRCQSCLPFTRIST